MDTSKQSPLEAWSRALEPAGHALDPSDTPTEAPSHVLHRATPDVTIEELRARLERGDTFLLAMAMDRDRFKRAHIPGSIDGDTLITTAATLARDTEIIVYCTGPECAASRVGAAMLREAGFTNVRRFSGGLAEWARAGLSLATGDNAAAA